MKTILNISSLSLLALLATSRMVSAQGTDGTAEAASEAESFTEAEKVADGEASADEPVSMEAALSQAETTLSRIEKAADNIERMLRNARRDKDVVKVLCLDDKLNQMNVARRAAADRVEGMSAAVAAGSEDRVQHDSAVIEALGERANAISAEANQCIGEEKGFVGGSDLQITVDPDIPSEDTSDIPSPDLVSQPPVAASPTF